MDLDTMEKVRARITQQFFADPDGQTFLEAAAQACWDAVKEAREAGWAEPTITNLMSGFQKATIDMVREATRT